MLTRFLITVLIAFLLFGCGEDSPTESKQASISGKVQFLDGTVAANAEIRLIIVQSNQNKFTATDENGNYSFENLSPGNYEVSFISPTYEINSYRSDEINLSGSNIVHDIIITYHILDELKSKVVSDSVFLIQYQPDGAKIGNNFSAVSKMTGYYRPGAGVEITFDCDVYEMPASYSWNDADSLSPAFVKQNFTFLMSLADSSSGFFHSVELTGEKIEKILSNPPNGFVFIKSTSDSKVLKIPCVDFNNNDFGWVIEYN